MNARREHFFGMAESMVRERFAKSGVEPDAPKFFVYRTRPVNEVVICPAPFDLREARRNIADALSAPYVAAIGMVHEAWIATGAAARLMQATGQRASDLPEDTPGRGEAIVASYFSREAKPKMIYIMIEGKGPERRLGPTVRDYAGDDPSVRSAGFLVDGLGGDSH